MHLTSVYFVLLYVYFRQLHQGPYRDLELVYFIQCLQLYDLMSVRVVVREAVLDSSFRCQKG